MAESSQKTITLSVLDTYNTKLKTVNDAAYVARAEDMSLMSKTEHEKLADIEENAQVNVIETVSVNGTPVEIDENKNVDIDLSGKVDVEEGKGLSTNDLTNELKAQYDAAEQNVQADWNETDEESDAFILNKPNLNEYGKVQSISVNGVKVEPDEDKNVDIDLSGKVDVEEGKSLVADEDIAQITTNKEDIETLNGTGEGSVRKIVANAISEQTFLSKVIATQSEIDGYIADPTTADFNKIYLLYKADATGKDKYLEYQRLGDAEASTFVLTGDTSTDLSDYVKKEEGKGLFSGSYSDLTDVPEDLAKINDIPTTVAELEDAEDYAKVKNVVGKEEVDTGTLSLLTTKKEGDKKTLLFDGKEIEADLIEITEAELQTLIDRGEFDPNAVYFITDGDFNDPVHTYSTNERIVGKWIDGSDVYEKLCVGTISEETTSDTRATSANTIVSDVKTIVSVDGYYDFVYSNVGYSVSVNGTNSSTSNTVSLTSRVAKSGNNAVLYVERSTAYNATIVGQEYRVVIRYIKN